MMERLKESRWLYILVSVLIAVAFWLYIRNVQNTASDYTIYNVPVQITNSRVLNERGLTHGQCDGERPLERPAEPEPE